MGLGKRFAGAGQMLDDRFQTGIGNDLEAFQRIARCILAMQQQRAGRLQRSHARPDDDSLGDGRNQLQGGGGDDPERAFRADQQLLEIEAAVVLLERSQHGKDAAVGKHRFDAQDQRAHRTVA